MIIYDYFISELYPSFILAVCYSPSLACILSRILLYISRQDIYIFSMHCIVLLFLEEQRIADSSLFIFICPVSTFICIPI